MSADPLAATRPLAGRSVRPFDGRVASLVVLLATGVATVALVFISPPAGAAALGLAAAGMVALILRHNAGARRINAAVKLMTVGDFAGAEPVLASVAVGRYTQACVALALCQLATVSTRLGDTASAGVLYSGSLALYRRQKIRSLRSGEHLARAGFAFMQACAGDLAGAEAVLAAPVELTLPQAHASEVLTRALVALRRGDAREALDVLARSRVFLRNACAGEAAALAEAIEAFAGEAMAEMGQPYRGELTIPRSVAVDQVERAYVLRALPGCERLLVDA